MRVKELCPEKLGKILINLTIAARQGNYSSYSGVCSGLDTSTTEREFIRDISMMCPKDMINKWYGGEQGISEILAELQEQMGKKG